MKNKVCDKILPRKILSLVFSMSEKKELVLTVNDKNFASIVREGLVVIDCYADWCGPCRMISPIVETLAFEYRGKVKFGKLNTDDNQKIAASFGVMAIPTLLFFKDGKYVDRIVGVVPKHEIEKKLYNFMKS